MKNIINRFTRPIQPVRSLFVLGLALCMVTGALATDPPPNDYTSSLTTANTSLVSLVTTNAPSLFGLLIVMLGFGFVWRLIKRAVKSA